MGEIKDPYKILGIVPDEADDEKVKRAYRKRSFTCHPDLHPGDAAKEAEFRQLSEAFHMIDTEAKRDALKNRAGVSLRKGPEGAHTEFFKRLFKLGI